MVSVNMVTWWWEIKTDLVMKTPGGQGDSQSVGRSTVDLQVHNTYILADLPLKIQPFMILN